VSRRGPHVKRGAPENPLAESDVPGTFLDSPGTMIKLERPCKTAGLVAVLDQVKDGREIVQFRHSKKE
jgi:hypothetical protein